MKDPRTNVGLRWYQREAVDHVYAHLASHRTHPCVVLPTGSGKSWVIAQICSDAVRHWDGRVLVLAHRRELLEQNAEKIRRLAPDLDVGLHSAGLGARDVANDVIVAGIQSAFRQARAFGRVDLIVVDEAHLIPAEGEGMYRRFLRESAALNSRQLVVGLTATPYRLDSGPLCGPDEILQEVIYEIGVRELIAKGFLAPLVAREGSAVADLEDVSIRGGDFDPRELDIACSKDQLVDRAAREILRLAAARRSCLLFGAGVLHAERITVKMRELGVACESINGETPASERERILRAFRSGELRFLTNCDVLTTGFDAPSIDCVVLLRPTHSPGLYYQMVGRGLRVAEGKKDCLVLDYAGNVRRHGPVDKVRKPPGVQSGTGEPVVKCCPECRLLIPGGHRRCPECGHFFPDPLKHGDRASDLSPLATDATTWRPVTRVRYELHRKYRSTTSALRVIHEHGRGLETSEYVALEQGAEARDRAVHWWKGRSKLPCPYDASKALRIARRGDLRDVRALLLRESTGARFPEIVGYDLRPVARADSSGDMDSGPDDASSRDRASRLNRHSIAEESTSANDASVDEGSAETDASESWDRYLDEHGEAPF